MNLALNSSQQTKIGLVVATTERDQSVKE